eukprot:TRINITY_DN6707_c0_g1_i1.p1 TRINITY_DN6707_c0_g1~~TRINITY_DN6707_c0_g1_i1.p1  ORF type:complete len:119 (-),score=29.69 TRINITY_DN6707_c0_g1_i1:157-513(-)
MADRQDWWGYLVFGFFIILFVIFLIKIFIEFPGLLEWRFVFSDDDDTNSDDQDVERNEILEQIATYENRTPQPKKCAKVKADLAATEEKEMVKMLKYYDSQQQTDMHYSVILCRLDTI